jgi:hypothetical protein
MTIPTQPTVRQRPRARMLAHAGGRGGEEPRTHLVISLTASPAMYCPFPSLTTSPAMNGPGKFVAKEVEECHSVFEGKKVTMGRSRSRSRSRSRERREKRSRPSDDYPSSRDFDRQDSRRTFTYRPSPVLRWAALRAVARQRRTAPLRPHPARRGTGVGWGGVLLAAVWRFSSSARPHRRTRCCAAGSAPRACAWDLTFAARVLMLLQGD